MRAKVISFGNHKGGVGKTTTTANVGSSLASKNYKVLLIDLDPQSNLSTSLLTEWPQETIYDALSGKISFLPIIHLSSTLDIVPASLSLESAEIELISMMSREMILSRLLEPVLEEYDFILIDCRPALTLLTMNAFAASDGIIVPMVAEVLPSNGLMTILDFIDKVHTHLNQRTHLIGILLTHWQNVVISKDIEKRIREKFGNLVFNVKIRRNIKLSVTPLHHQSIVDYAPRSHGASDYIAFTEELLHCLSTTDS